MTKKTQQHEPVLLEEVLNYLHIKTNAQYIDATLGAGGHAEAIIKKGGYVLGIDDDKKMLEIASLRLTKACLALNKPIESCFVAALGNFRNISSIANAHGMTAPNGILLDLGISSVHYDADDRGFAFRDKSKPLDMRINTNTQKVTASDLLNALSKTQLIDLFKDVTGYEKASSLASEILKKRQTEEIKTVGDLAEITERVMPRNLKIDPSTKPFMALRIAVNTELENLELCLPQAFELLEVDGFMVVITFHSLEDRIVKIYFKRLSEQGKAGLLTKKPVKASDAEIKNNPRARSASLRALKKLKY